MLVGYLYIFLEKKSVGFLCPVSNWVELFNLLLMLHIMFCDSSFFFLDGISLIIYYFLSSCSILSILKKCNFLLIAISIFSGHTSESSGTAEDQIINLCAATFSTN